ncbi:carboxypeptidase-like regulatory domain-containing protein, partial [Candidatus Latescibacterota bacterium]
MNIYNKKVMILILMTALSGMSGCGKDPVRVEQVSYSKLSVTVVDELGEPLEGINVVTFPKSSSVFTDENGHAIFEQIKSGQYQVVASRNDIPIFYKETFLRKFKEVEMVF